MKKVKGIENIEIDSDLYEDTGYIKCILTILFNSFNKVFLYEFVVFIKAESIKIPQDCYAWDLNTNIS